ncbi:hypothetical protein GCM10009869_31700 [Amnibacterium kyonggiense]
MTLRKVKSDARGRPSALLVLEDSDRALGFYYAGALGGSGAIPTDLVAVSWFGRCVPVICGKTDASIRWRTSKAELVPRNGERDAS